MTVDYKALCAPFIQASQECKKENYKKIEHLAQQHGFFKALPALKSFADFNDFIDSSPSLENLASKIFKDADIDLDECDAPVINLRGEVVNPSLQYVDVNGYTHFKWINAGKLLHCSRLVEVLRGDSYQSVSDDNAVIEVLNRNGFDIPLLELPNYSNDDIAQMFGL